MGIQSNIRDALLPQPPSFKKKKEYTILETLGRGGFGKVVKAHWKGEGEGKDVALKYVCSLYPSHRHFGSYQSINREDNDTERVDGREGTDIQDYTEETCQT